MKKLRLLVTQLCNRSCAGCCNKEWNLNGLPQVMITEEYDKYDEVIITGGEPLLFPDKTVDLAKSIKILNPNIKVYLYTAHIRAFWNTFMRLNKTADLAYFDGFHITIHEDVDEFELDLLEQLQLFDNMFKDHSMRLQVFPDVEHRVRIKPAFWKRITFNPWIENCPLPQDEVFAQHYELFTHKNQ